ncbi:urease accessory protein UreF [Dietzia sp. PP-33]|jgi:urease accessory protein|uniref:urease accessory protein UreF n=1 Tax=Dietzia sp. PP-33 TaxID=2957500 RepID=UPI0029B7B461|nr:urease accessory UreF family protein [Dietzia sp. PP-33]MDX2356080.1 urease accessory protein UreF [Dietzia sp. PP-33]
MGTEPLLADLAWLQLHDSAFPSGRFVHSNGLEAWLALHPSAGEPEIRDAVRAYVRGSVATLDAVVLGHAWLADSTETLVRLDHLDRVHKITRAARTSSESCGRQLATVARRVLSVVAGSDYLGLVVAGHTPGNQAVVDGVVQRALGVERDRAIAGAIRSSYAGLLSAAVRLGRTGPMRAQQLLFDDTPWIADLARTAECAPLESVTSFVPELEIAAMRHETTAARLFST